MRTMQANPTCRPMRLVAVARYVRADIIAGTNLEVAP